MKVCDVGQHEVTVLFHSRKPNKPSCCKNCYRPEQSIARKEKVAQKVCIKAKRTKISPISDRQKKRLSDYRKVRDKFMSEHPMCEFNGCESKATDLHHKKGKVGDLLTDTRYFSALCRTHHSYIELHPILAQELGLSVKRLDK
jgi:hypothetical protein